MGTGYTRNDTSGNIANGKVIDATDLDGEFDAIVTAFSTSGHTHDGTAAEGGKVTKLLGTSLTLGDGTAGTDITVTFDGETSDGVLVWMEDEDYFQFNDDILMNTSEKLQFRDTGIYISSNADGDLDIVSDGTAVDSINIESAGGITLDAGTAASGVIFEDDGTEMLRIYNSSSDVYIESKVSDKDILIRGNDGGSAVTAVTFDMSAAGLATFGGGLTSTAVANTLGATSFNDANITNVGNIALDSITADGSTITITGNTTFADGPFNFNIASHDGSNGLQLGGTLVTATAAELNIMDGVTSTAAELNILDGVTSTAAEINILDGVTSTAAELNILDGDTSASSVTIVDADRVVLNDNGTMKQVAASDIKTYVGGASTAGQLSAGTGNTAIGANALDSMTGDDADYNTALGSNALTAITTGDGNVAIGFDANAGGTAGSNNVSIGFEALKAGGGTNGSALVSIGYRAMDEYTGGFTHVAVGAAALGSMTGGSQQDNCAVGDGAGANANDASGSGNRQNSFFGNSSGSRNTTGSINTCIGYSAGGLTGTGMTGVENTFVGGYASGSVTSGDYNTSVGRSAGQDLTTGDKNTSIGYAAGQEITTGGNNLFLGVDAGRSGSPGGAQTTGSNEIFLGDENITAANIQVDWTVASDQRDKTDFSALDIGLDFVNALKPYTYKWDKRIKYVDKTSKKGLVKSSIENGVSTEDKWEDSTNLDDVTTDGTHKEDWLDIGFKAQEVETLEKAAGYKIETKTNLTTSLTKDGKQYGIQYNKFIPILVKAVQELSAKNIALEARVKTLEG